MLLYSIIMFFLAAPLFGISLAIYRGKTGLIHSYHQTRVADKSAYGKAFGKAMFVISAALPLSGILGLAGDSSAFVMAALAVLLLGFLVGIACIIAVQKKYNNGIF